MGAAQLKEEESSRRSALRRAMEEMKSDMGMMDLRARAVLKPWDRLKTPAPAQEPFSFDSLLRDTGT